jgi:prepilin-type N-terminal cleavage/methylation domain-containing protein
MKFFKKEKGFTLIELLVVIAIIGVLATIVLSSLNSARSKAENTKFLNNIRDLQTKLELYHLDNNQYPPGIYSSQYNEDIINFAGYLDEIDVIDLHPCNTDDPSQIYSCDLKFSYVSFSERGGSRFWQDNNPRFGDQNCWKNHYVITIELSESITPVEGEADQPCNSTYFNFSAEENQSASYYEEECSSLFEMYEDFGIEAPYPSVNVCVDEINTSRKNFRFIFS